MLQSAATTRRQSCSTEPPIVEERDMKKHPAYLWPASTECYEAAEVDAFMSVTGLTKLVERIAELEEALKQRENQLRIALDRVRSDH